MSSGTGLILLAAGGSSRMGQPKQLLIYQGKSLLRHAALAACASVCTPVVVVLGAAAALCRVELKGLETSAVENTNWQAGMGTSIRAGLNHLLELAPQISGAVIMLCDQPKIGPDEINQLVDQHRATQMELVGTQYPGSVGVPAYFARTIFPQLQSLPDGAGCKQLLNADLSRTAAVQLPGALFDVDTLDDYRKIRH